jgi:RNA polymerase-associated protein
MMLYSSPTCFHSHRTRLVLAEKNITMDIVNVQGPDLPEDLRDLNPYHSVPTLVDRDLVLYDSRVIIEYLDERFPHPPLMPVDPVTRAQFRLALYRIERDWYGLGEELEAATDSKQASRLRKMLRESILSSAEVFSARRFFLSEEFSLVDCTIAPLLWRLSVYNVDLGEAGAPVVKYMDDVFSRRSFQDSLTELESAISTSQHPYLLRAMHEWMTDNGDTPHIVVDAQGEGVDVPEQFITDGKIILNVSYAAVRDLQLGNEEISFEARFGGVPNIVRVPVAAILGIYARETGRGMIFSIQQDSEVSPPEDVDGDSPPTGGRPHLKVVK